MTLTLDTQSFMYSFSWLHLPTFISQTTIVSEKSVNFFQYKSISDQIWPCSKTGQGQPRGIIWTNLVVFEYSMLHTKCQGHRPFGSREEHFWRFLPYMDMAAILVMWPFEQAFVPPSQGGYLWNLASNGLVVIEEKFKKIESEWTWSKSTNDLDFWYSHYVHVLI